MATLPKLPVGSEYSNVRPMQHVELYHDLACPFSSKMLSTLMTDVIPAYEGKIRWQLHQVVQPWHPQSTMMHEAALAVRQVAPSKFWAFCLKITEYRQCDFIDDTTYDLTRSQIYDKLADIAKAVGASRSAVREKLELKGVDNSGTWVTADLKAEIQHHRKRGVHVTPTVFVNGIEATNISSSWTGEEWKVFLDGLSKR